MNEKIQNMKQRRAVFFILAAAVVLSAIVAIVDQAACSASPFFGDRSPSGRRDKPLELIVVPEEEEWLVLVAAPIAAQIKSKQKTPILIVLSSDQSEEQRRLLDQLNLFSESCSVLSQDQDRGLFEVPDERPVRLKVVRPSLAQVSVLLAESFWKKADTVVAASTGEPETAILGSTLAAHLRVPFIPYQNPRDLRALSRVLKAVGAGKLLFCTDYPERSQRIASSFPQKVEFLDCSSASKRVIDLLGTSKIRNLILARVPEPETGQGASSWIGPYLSLMRGAPVVLCPSVNGTFAEERAKDLINKYSLRPHTVTILGDYDSIGTITMQDSDRLGEYEVPIEPCSRPFHGGPAVLGVGRIPFRRLWASSTIIAQGLAREHILQGQEPRVLMVANPNCAYGSLPLAETISRVTAEEFKNFGARIDEFYGVRSNNPGALEAAGKAHLIIYEGHVSDQFLFQDPGDTFESEETPEEWQYAPPDELPGAAAPEGDVVFSASDTLAGSEFDEPRPLKEGRDEEREYENYQNAEVFPMEPGYMAPEEIFPYAAVEHLDGLPLVVLQSCHSLEEEIASQIFKAGGVGLVGSVTNVYSASGSAFVKAFCDGLVYQHETAGEALRDARNYFLCLAELKKKRGHTETAKVYRAALSFCLWGDPELRITAGLPNKTKLKPISAKLIPPDKMSISTPRRRLPELRTEKYFVRIFPASQVAGIVKRLKTREERRLTPIYFFRLPVPEGFDARQHSNLQRKDDPPNRAVFMTDSFKRFLYVLYFPSKEKKNNKFELRFTK